MQIPDDKVSEVRERATIYDVVAEYVSLRKSGANYQGLCPFHGEKTPSFNVNPARGIFHCFGCGVGGDVFAFVMKIEGVGFTDAVKLLAKRVGVTIEERSMGPAEKRRSDERELCFQVNELAAGYYRKLLLEAAEGEQGRRYLEKRGVDAAVSEAYRLGYACDRWDGLTRFLEQRKAPLAVAEKLGLIRKRNDGRGYYDLFRNRLLFCISDYQGRVIAFGGRVLDDSLPKYINSPESPVYHKSEALFGINLARQAMREQGSAIIVEGYFDHLALYRAGVRNVVATCGTALTIEHMKALKRYAGKLYTLFDADSAGKKATFRAMELALDEQFPSYVVELTAGDDPDSFLAKEGAGAFTGRLERAKPVFEYFLSETIREGNAGNIDGKVRIVEELLPRLAKIANPVERDNYLVEIARRLEIDLPVLRRRLGRPAPLSAAEVAPRRAERKRGGGSEETLLLLMARYPEVTGRARDYGLERLFGADLVPVAAEIAAQSAPHRDLDLPKVLECCVSDEERRRLSALFINDSHLEEIDHVKAFEECRTARERAALDEMKALKQELARLDSDNGRYWEILERLNALRNIKSRLS